MAEICYIDWHTTPWRGEQWLEEWEPFAARALAFGAKSWSLSRSIDNPQLFRQGSVWESREDFERYWFSDEVAAARERVMEWYDKPLLPGWHRLIGHE